MAGLFDNLMNQVSNKKGDGDITPANNEIVKPSKTLLEWEAPERVFKRKSRDFFRKIAVIIIFFALMFLIIKDFIFIIVLGIIFFVVYVFNTVPPRNVVHKITTNGVNYASEQLYSWTELKSFYIEEKSDTAFLVIDTVQPFPGRLLLILTDKVNKRELAETLNQYISVNENPEPNMFDSFIGGISKRLNV